MILNILNLGSATAGNDSQTDIVGCWVQECHLRTTEKKGPQTELCGIADKTGKNNEMYSGKCFDTVWSNNLHVKL